MAIKMQPLADRVLVHPLEEKEQKRRIIIPDTAKEKPQEGEVVALGTGKTDDKGEKSPSPSRPATVCSSANTAAPRSRSTARAT